MEADDVVQFAKDLEDISLPMISTEIDSAEKILKENEEELKHTLASLKQEREEAIREIKKRAERMMTEVKHKTGENRDSLTKYIADLKTLHHALSDDVKHYKTLTDHKHVTGKQHQEKMLEKLREKITETRKDHLVSHLSEIDIYSYERSSSAQIDNALGILKIKKSYPEFKLHFMTPKSNALVEKPEVEHSEEHPDEAKEKHRDIDAHKRHVAKGEHEKHPHFNLPEMQLRAEVKFKPGIDISKLEPVGHCVMSHNIRSLCATADGHCWVLLQGHSRLVYLCGVTGSVIHTLHCAVTIFDIASHPQKEFLYYCSDENNTIGKFLHETGPHISSKTMFTLEKCPRCFAVTEDTKFVIGFMLEVNIFSEHGQILSRFHGCGVPHSISVDDVRQRVIVARGSLMMFNYHLQPLDFEYEGSEDHRETGGEDTKSETSSLKKIYTYCAIFVQNGRILLIADENNDRILSLDADNGQILNCFSFEKMRHPSRVSFGGDTCWVAMTTRKDVLSFKLKEE